MKHWEIIISTGNTNTGQVGLIFALKMDSLEQPSTKDILERATDALDGFDSVKLCLPGDAVNVMLFTNSETLTEADISDITEVDEDGDPIE